MRVAIRDTKALKAVSPAALSAYARAAVRRFRETLDLLVRTLPNNASTPLETVQ